MFGPSYSDLVKEEDASVYVVGSMNLMRYGVFVLTALFASEVFVPVVMTVLFFTLFSQAKAAENIRLASRKLGVIHGLASKDES